MRSENHLHKCEKKKHKKTIVVKIGLESQKNFENTQTPKENTCGNY